MSKDGWKICFSKISDSRHHGYWNISVDYERLGDNTLWPAKINGKFDG